MNVKAAPALAVAPTPATNREQSSRSGLICGLAAYTAWGFIPLYFRAVSDVSPFIVLCHRIFWSVLFVAILISARNQWAMVWPIFRNRRSMLLLSAGAAFIAINWLIFIYSVSSRQLFQSSLGYFINPLFSIFLGMIFLRERLRRWQWVAVIIAGLGVVNLALGSDRFPWIALSLAGSFGMYGLVRKKVDIDSLHGLLVETTVLLPIAMIVLALPTARHVSTHSLVLLSLAGVVTAVPLLFFGIALRQLKLSTMGFLQYVGPTLQFLVALVVFHEKLDPAKLASFALCWLAIGVYAADSILTRQPQVCEEPD